MICKVRPINGKVWDKNCWLLAQNYEIVFWDAQGVIMLDFLAKESTITGAYYANLLD